MPEYLSVTQFAKLHGLDTANIRKLIKHGRLPEATKIGSQWCIPADTPKPEDRRVKSGQYRGWRKKDNENSDT